MNFGKDHICEKDSKSHINKCRICGKTMNPAYYGNDPLHPPYDIYYFDFQSIVNNECKKNCHVNF